MALTADSPYPRRGQPGRNDFGYPLAPGEQVYVGSLTCINASGQMIRVQTAGGVAFGGMADRNLSNVGNAAASSISVTGRTGTFALTVPSATYANIGASVYATDDNTLTLTAPTTGFTQAIGTLVGIENGQTWVQLVRS